MLSVYAGAVKVLGAQSSRKKPADLAIPGSDCGIIITELPVPGWTGAIGAGLLEQALSPRIARK